MPDDGIPTVRDLLLRHQENAGTASVVALMFAAVYAAYKNLTWRKSLLAAGSGALFAALVWVMVAEYLRPAIFWLLPVGAVCGFAVFPLMTAWAKQDDAIADGVVSGAGGFLGRLIKRLTGGA
jgi:hypothetical protein